MADQAERERKEEAARKYFLDSVRITGCATKEDEMRLKNILIEVIKEYAMAYADNPSLSLKLRRTSTGGERQTYKNDQLILPEVIMRKLQDKVRLAHLDLTKVSVGLKHSIFITQGEVFMEQRELKDALPRDLGKGTSKRVFKGVSLKGDMVAIVVAVEKYRSGELQAALQRESEVRAKIGIPQILPVKRTSKGWHTGLQPNEPRNQSAYKYFYIEPLAQGTLREYMMTPGRTDADILWALWQVVDAAIKMHDKGEVHIDIKSPNVLWGVNGGIMLSDFGLTERVGELIFQFSPQYGVDYSHPLSHNVAFECWGEERFVVSPAIDVFGLVYTILKEADHIKDPVLRKYVQKEALKAIIIDTEVENFFETAARPVEFVQIQEYFTRDQFKTPQARGTLQHLIQILRQASVHELMKQVVEKRQQAIDSSTAVKDVLAGIKRSDVSREEVLDRAKLAANKAQQAATEAAAVVTLIEHHTQTMSTAYTRQMMSQAQQEVGMAKEAARSALASVEAARKDSASVAAAEIQARRSSGSTPSGGAPSSDWWVWSPLKGGSQIDRALDRTKRTSNPRG